MKVKLITVSSIEIVLYELVTPETIGSKINANGITF